MKRMIVKYVYCFVLASLLMGCASTPQPKSEFEEQTGMNIVVPMRFYTWIKNNYSSKVQEDIANRKLTFSYDGTADFLIKVTIENGNIQTIWGKQSVLQDQLLRNSMILTPFISSAYAISENKDPIDSAFDVLKQICDEPSYKAEEASLIPVLKNGLIEYRKGGSDWTSYKELKFEYSENTLRIK
jgi:hypothetical protein